MNVEVKEEVLMEQLRVENPEFQKWELEHQQLEDSLTSFESRRHLTPEEEVERKRLQKLKLAAKDRMMDIIRRMKVGSA